jgi:hypothetical protein
LAPAARASGVAAASVAEDGDKREQKLFYPGMHISWGYHFTSPPIVFILLHKIDSTPIFFIVFATKLGTAIIMCQENQRILNSIFPGSALALLKHPKQFFCHGKPYHTTF